MAKDALLVGSMQSRVDILQASLTKLGWTVSSFLNPKDAAEALSNETYQAVFCDEQLRGASVAGLLVWTRRTAPELPFYLFSNSYEPERFRHAGEPSAVLHFPPVPAQLPLPDQAPQAAPVAAAAGLPMRGNTSLVPLADLIEMMGIAQQSGVVELDGGKAGLLVLKKGRLEHALAHCAEAPRSGLQALAHLLRLDASEFQVLPYRAAGRPTINLGTAAAVTEAVRLADEARRFQQLVVQVQARCPEVSAVAAGHPVSGVPFQGVGEVQALAETAQQVLEASRKALGSRLLEALLVTEDQALVVRLFGEGNLLAASAPPVARAKLYRAVQASLRS